MPFKSQAQRAWMYATHPQMARKWQAETPKGKLPTKVKTASLHAALVHNAANLGMAAKDVVKGDFGSTDLKADFDDQGALQKLYYALANPYGHHKARQLDHLDAASVWGALQAGYTGDYSTLPQFAHEDELASYAPSGEVVAERKRRQLLG